MAADLRAEPALSLTRHQARMPQGARNIATQYADDVSARCLRSGSAARPQPRRGTFALEPVEALPRLVGADRAAGRARARDQSVLPAGVPRARHPGARARRRCGWRSSPTATTCTSSRPWWSTAADCFGGRQFSVWAHPYAPLGTPLIDREMAPQVADSLIEHMRTSGRTLFSIPHLPLKGPAAEALRAAAERSGFCDGRRAADAADPLSRRGRRHRRVRPDGQPEAAARARPPAPAALRGRRRSASCRRARATEIEAAFNMFIALEASGWKGRRGTALARRRASTNSRASR